MEQVFEIVIFSCENHTWQGTLRVEDEAVPFQSELELLLALFGILPPEEPDASGWNTHESRAG